MVYSQRFEKKDSLFKKINDFGKDAQHSQSNRRQFCSKVGLKEARPGICIFFFIVLAQFSL